jgi:uncharacterized protein YjbJ (UPF0337 family)
MDDDRKTASASEIRGSVKEAIGKVTGNKRAETEGAAEKKAAREHREHLRRQPDSGRSRS